MKPGVNLLDGYERGIGLSLGALMTAGAAIVLVSAFASAHWVRVFSLGLIMACGFAGIVLVLCKRAKAGYIVLVSGAWLGSMGGLISGGGSMAPVSIVFPLLLFFAAWIGSGVVLAFGLATFAAFVGLGYAARHDLLPVHYAIAPGAAVTVQLVVLVGCIAFAYFAARVLRGRLEHLTASRQVLGAKLEELHAAQDVLTRLNASLEAEIARRTSAESEILELNRSLELRVAARTAELQMALKEIESFSYSVSHDLRAPLRGIVGRIALLRGDFGTRFEGDPMVHLDRIETGALRMSELIDDLLNLSRVSRNQLCRELVDMRAMVEGVIDEASPQTATRTMFLVGDLPPATGDPGLLRQVWQNLVDNALKFTGKVAQPRIEIDGASDGRFVEYWVRDNGAGFNMAYVDKIFGVFQRLHSADEFGGTGIGLATVQRIVERHGGTVSAEGSVDHGAVIRFRLPATSPDAGRPGELDNRAAWLPSGCGLTGAVREPAKQ
jgi:signal transduction histidine kinase